jgi:hypothetical protein
MWRYAGKADNAWTLSVRIADGTELPASNCIRPVDQFTCELGGPYFPPVDWPHLQTSTVRVVLACESTPTTCAPGATLHEAWTAIYRSIVTIDDPTPPTASGATGSLFAGGYVRGNATATLGSAADGSGIKAVQVRVDGSRVVGETALACDFTRSRPCSDVPTPTDVPVVTANIGDGTHTAEVGAVDAGGNFTAATTQAITVDNEAPAPPTPTSPSFTTVAGERATISWTEPSGQVSPITRAHITVCKATACRTSTQPAGFGFGQASVALLDGPGAYTASVALADGAGNHDPYRAAHWSITRAGPSPTAPMTAVPTVPPTQPVTALPSARLSITASTIARDRRSITVRGTVAPGVHGRVHVTVRTRIAGRLHTVATRTAIARHRFQATLRLPSRRWRTATLTARYVRTTTHRETVRTRTIHNR